MTWTRLPDDFNDWSVLLAVGRSARLLHVEALVWCNRLLTDGAVPRGALPRLSDSPDPDADVTELVAAGLWAETDTGWQLDWADQEAAANVEQRRAQYRARDERRRKHNDGDHSLCDPKRCWVLRGDTTRETTRDSRVSDGVSHAPPVPTRSVPTPREGRGREGGAAARSASATRAARPPGDDVGVVRTLPDGRRVIDMGDGGDEW